MRQSRSAGRAGVSSDVGTLVRGLQQVSAAIEQARLLGVDVAVPADLYEICNKIVRQQNLASGHGGSVDSKSGSTESEGGSSRRTGRSGKGRVKELDVRAQDVPLRRLVLQVITPGREFTVADVTKDLRDLGATWEANKVSNALGYWVGRGRLERSRKGVYICPVLPRMDDLEGVTSRDEPVALQARAKGADRKERDANEEAVQTKRAM